MKTNRWVILEYTMCDGWAPILTITEEGETEGKIGTFATEQEAWDECKDDIALRREAHILDGGDADEDETTDEPTEEEALAEYQVVPYDPEIHDEQWRKATGVDNV